MKKIYFASPLFTHMEFRYNAEVVAQIRSVYPKCGGLPSSGTDGN
ncbi:hypothetical protein [Erysipelothrix piscisicarius]